MCVRRLRLLFLCVVFAARSFHIYLFIRLSTECSFAFCRSHSFCFLGGCCRCVFSSFKIHFVNFSIQLFLLWPLLGCVQRVRIFTRAGAYLNHNNVYLFIYGMVCLLLLFFVSFHSFILSRVGRHRRVLRTRSKKHCCRRFLLYLIVCVCTRTLMVRALSTH